MGKDSNKEEGGRWKHRREEFGGIEERQDHRGKYVRQRDALGEGEGVSLTTSFQVGETHPDSIQESPLKDKPWGKTFVCTSGAYLFCVCTNVWGISFHGCFSALFFFFFLRWDSQWTWSLFVWLGWLTISPREPPSSPALRLEQSIRSLGFLLDAGIWTQMALGALCQRCITLAPFIPFISLETKLAHLVTGKLYSSCPAGTRWLPAQD